MNTRFLKDNLDNGGSSWTDNVYNHTVNSYLEGNFADTVLTSQLLNPTASLSKRNRIWVENITANCRQGESCFIFGGLAHMLNSSDNVVALLQAKGFRVKPIE